MRLTPKATNMRCMLFITGLILSYRPQPVQSINIAGFTAVIPVINLSREIASNIVHTWQLIDDDSPLMPLIGDKIKYDKIIDKINQINRKIDDIEHQVSPFV